jgi:hypothetical protein
MSLIKVNALGVGTVPPERCGLGRSGEPAVADSYTTASDGPHTDGPREKAPHLHKAACKWLGSVRKRSHFFRILGWKSRFCPVTWRNGPQTGLVRRHHLLENAVGRTIAKGRVWPGSRWCNAAPSVTTAATRPRGEGWISKPLGSGFQHTAERPEHEVQKICFILATSAGCDTSGELRTVGNVREGFWGVPTPSNRTHLSSGRPANGGVSVWLSSP